MPDTEDEEGLEEEGVEVKGPKCPISVIFAEGKLQFRLGNFQKAIEVFDSIIEREPTNSKVFVLRSKCYFILQDYDKAMADTEEAIKLNSKNPVAIFQKGEIQYTMGDFEFAYITFQRGQKRRPDFHGFHDGLQKCKTAILNAIGPQSGLRITQKLVKQVEDRLRRKRREYSTVRKDASKQQETVDNANLEDDPKMRLVLGKLQVDEDYFKMVRDKPPISVNIDPDDTTLVDQCNKALEFLKSRRKFWMMQKPLHSRKVISCVVRVPLHTISSVYSDVSSSQSLVSQVPAVELLQKAEGFQKEGLTQDAIALCLTLTKSSPSTIALDKSINRAEYMARVYEVLGHAYRDQSNWTTALQYHKRQLKLATNHQLENHLYAAFENVAFDYRMNSKFEDSLRYLNGMLKLCHDEITEAHVIVLKSQCHMIMGNFDKAKETAARVQEIGKRLDHDLEINGTVLMANTYVAEGNLEIGLAYYQAALDLALKYEDKISEDDILENIMKTKELMEEVEWLHE